jgi:hypothetical protein
MPKSLGDKRRRLSLEHIDEVLDLYRRIEEGERSKIRENDFFMFRRITVERPLRLRYQVSEEAIDRLRASKAFEGLAKPPANVKDQAKAIERGGAAQRAIVDALRALNGSPRRTAPRRRRRSATSCAQSRSRLQPSARPSGRHYRCATRGRPWSRTAGASRSPTRSCATTRTCP